MSLQIHHDYDARLRNTLRLKSTVHSFAEVHSLDELGEALCYASENNLRFLPLGSGSNIVLGMLENSFVASIDLQGIVLVSETDDWVLVDVAAGENWHTWVQYSLQQGWFGLENLSLIPGKVGAAPIQNIGAYGVEVGAFIEHVSYVDIAGGSLANKNTVEEKTLAGSECRFGYRDSIFKHELAGKVVITGVRFRLPKKDRPVVSYPQLRDYLEDQLDDGAGQCSAQDLANAVIAIRQQKLPDPAKIPNAGSFFKNCVVDKAQFNILRERFPSMPYFRQGEQYKLPSAWLIEQCGYKGKRFGDLAMHSKQALVLTNNNEGGETTAADVLALAAKISQSVRQQFGLELEIEPQLLV